MIAIISSLLVLVLGFPALGNCGNRYLEKETPAGEVAAPRSGAKAMPYRNNHDTGAPRVTPQVESDNPPLQAMSKFDSGSIQPAFQRTYQAAGKPSLAIYMNRTLSDEVREWRTDARGVVSVEGQMSRAEGEKSTSFKGPGGVSVYGQRHIENNTARANPADESWMWRFEEGFLAPFIDTRTAVIDRATIMRLAAADSGRQGSAHKPITVKQIEMDALLGKADLFIEVLVRREPRSQVGYAFKATAKEVKTGVICANVTSLDWDYSVKRETKKVVATDQGYQFVTETESAPLPDINVVSRDLALALMRSLTHSWQ